MITPHIAHQIVRNNSTITRENKMRDYNRIDRILAIIRSYWQIYPDLRLGQLIGNMCHDRQDLYYIEDEDLEKEIVAALERMSQR